VALDRDKICENIGRRIAELRQDRGWTQQTLATRLRTTFQWVSQLEKGSNLTVHSLVKVANILGVKPTELFETANPRVVRMGPGRPTTGIKKP
jgi:transcriptional regulator with XRE-family HTH domain